MIKKNENIIARQIHDSFFLIDIKQNYLDDKCSLYEINEMGYFIWNTLSSVKSEIEIVEIIKNEVGDNVDPALIADDVYSFLEILRGEGFVEIYGRD